MTSRIRVSLWVAVALAVICAFPCAARASQFLSVEINSALSARGDFLRRIDLPEKDFLSLGSILDESNRRGALKSRLESLGAGNSSPWRLYVAGVVYGEGGAQGERYFGGAIEAAAADPGALWLLALEFIRNGQTQFADASFDALYKWILASGGSSAPLLSQQLILLGNTLAGTAAASSAEYCYDMAKRFDKNQCWWLYRKGAIGFPQNVIATVPGFIGEAGETIFASWRAQASLLCGLHRFLSATLFIFACAIFLVFIVKYLPLGVHSIGDALFLGAGASPRMRTLSSFVVVASMLLAGVVPALWIIAFLVCRFLSANEKKLLIAACFILALSPLNYYVESFLSRNIGPRSPAVLLDRSMREGYSAGLYAAAAQNLSKRPDNYANHLALAISAVKSGDMIKNHEDMSKALKSAPDDPIALMYAGNLSFLTGNGASAMESNYGAVINNHPAFAAEAKFNLAQAYMNSGGFTAMDMISEAAKINPALIGGYMRENSRYFDDDPPRLRGVMQPALTPVYFWSRLFFADPLEILSIKGKTYYGLSPAAAFAVSAILMMVFLAAYYAAWSKESKLKKYFTCRICGRLLCRKCRKGTTCSVCYRKNIDSHNNAATMYNLQKKYQDRAILQKDLLKCALGIAVPGAGALYKGEKVLKPALTMLLSSAIFAAYYCAATFHTGYPSKAVVNPVYFVSILLVYNAAALVKQCLGLATTMKMRAKMLVKPN